VAIARGSQARMAILNRSRAGISAPISQRHVFNSLAGRGKDFSGRATSRGFYCFCSHHVAPPVKAGFRDSISDNGLI